MTNLPTKLREKRDEEARLLYPDAIDKAEVCYGPQWKEDRAYKNGYNQCYEDMLPLIREVKDILNLDECRCDEAYIKRGRHGPNEICGYLDDVRKALKEVLGDE